LHNFYLDINGAKNILYDKMSKKNSVKVAKKAIKDPDVNNIFGQLVGTTAPDPKIVSPKYEKIIEICNETISLIRDAFLKKDVVPPQILANFNQGFADLETFCTESKEEIGKLTIEKSGGALGGKDLKELNSNPELLQKYIESLNCPFKINELLPAYQELKTCKTVRRIIMTARDLKGVLDTEKKRKKTDKSDLDFDPPIGDFIENYDSDYLKLLKSITVLDFKQIWINFAATPDFKKRTLYALKLLQKKSIGLYNQICSPDIDAEKFSEILVNSIAKIQQVPELSRCANAFSKIKSNVNMLSNNLPEYYKDYIQTNNPGIIVENFVSDVAKCNEGNLALTQEFKTIVNYYRKVITKQGKNVDQKTNKLFDMVRENMDILEKDQKESPKQDDIKYPIVDDNSSTDGKSSTTGNNTNNKNKPLAANKKNNKLIDDISSDTQDEKPPTTDEMLKMAEDGDHKCDGRVNASGGTLLSQKGAKDKETKDKETKDNEVEDKKPDKKPEENPWVTEQLAKSRKKKKH
jgi:hypothetical protein